MVDENLKKLRVHNLGISRDINPDYFNIISEYDQIMTKWNVLNNSLHAIKQPRIFLFCQKSKFRSLYKTMEDLQKQFLEWNKKATNFINDPKLAFKENQEKSLGFVHFMNLLNDRRNTLNSNMILIADNFVKVQTRHTNQVNFNIAIFSAILSFLGLCLALYTLFLK